MLKLAQDAVEEFHRGVGQPVGAELGTDAELRIALIQEELNELGDALHETVATTDERLVDVADALADLIYVVLGSAVVWGIDLSPVFEEVHRSNMAKIVNGVVLRRADGKIEKPAGWTPPGIRKALGMEP